MISKRNLSVCIMKPGDKPISLITYYTGKDQKNGKEKEPLSKYRTGQEWYQASLTTGPVHIQVALAGSHFSKGVSPDA